MRISGKTAFVSILFVASIFVLGTKLLAPASISITVKGSDTAIEPIAGFFTFSDAIVIAVFACILGVCAVLLLLDSSQPAQAKKIKRDISGLKNDERRIYELVFDADGVMFQSEIVEETGFPKAKISRCLDLLESRGFVERKRKGMSNMVILK